MQWAQVFLGHSHVSYTLRSRRTASIKPNLQAHWCVQEMCRCTAIALRKSVAYSPSIKVLWRRRNTQRNLDIAKSTSGLYTYFCSNMTALLWQLIAWEQHSGQVFSFWCALKQLHAMKTWSRSSGNRVWESLFHYQVIPLLLLLNFKTKWCKRWTLILGGKRKQPWLQENLGKALKKEGTESDTVNGLPLQP